MCTDSLLGQVKDEDRKLVQLRSSWLARGTGNARRLLDKPQVPALRPRACRTVQLHSNTERR